MMGSKPSWANSTFVRTSLPMFGFVVVCWFGLSQLVDSKLRIRVSRQQQQQQHSMQEHLLGLFVCTISGSPKD
jgi:arginine exporter protein ArgO